MITLLEFIITPILKKFPDTEIILVSKSTLNYLFKVNSKSFDYFISLAYLAFSNNRIPVTSS
jgi:hypothetical protein